VAPTNTMLPRCLMRAARATTAPQSTCGVMAYTMLHANFPFGSPPVRAKIARGSFAACGGTPHAIDLIGSLLVVDPNSVQKINRLSSAEACKHPWLTPHEKAATAAAATAPEIPSHQLAEAVNAAASAVGGAEEEEEDEAPSAAPIRTAEEPAEAAADEAAGGGIEAEATAALLQLSLAAGDSDDD
jgi:hypothetical protein